MIKRKRGGSNIGVTPTQSQKLVYVSNKLGLTGMEKMQGSTVNLFDTVVLAANATQRQTLTFFSNTQGKSKNFSNFQNGTLGAGEAMVFESLTFYAVVLSATNLTLDATTMSQMIPLSQLDNSQVSLSPALMQGIVNIQIANSTVVKDFLTFEQNPSFNPKTTGISLGGGLEAITETLQQIFPVVGPNSIPLESPAVLPPNQKFSVTLEVPPVGTITGNIGIVCVLGRFGSIFAAKTTL
jgi:hypothetical protein